MTQLNQERILLQNNAGLAAQTFKQDANLLRSNELGGNSLLTQGLGQNNLGNNGGHIIEKDVRIVESNFGPQGSPRMMMQGSPNRQFVQGSPTGLYQGSPLKQTGFNQSLGQYSGYSTGTNSGSHSVHTTQVLQGQNMGTFNQGFSNQQQFVSGQNQQFVGETVIERIYEAPIVVTHNEQAIIKSQYEGREVLCTEERAVTQQIMNAPIVKEIHQDIIHEHHKDILVEHKKDIVHEHHQNIIHQHNQPIIYEKHIHEHHQPIIHEKHTTLIEEKHIPMVTETETFTQNVQERQNVVTEVFEAPVVKEVFVNPVRTEVFAETIVTREGSQFSGSNQFSGSHQSQFNNGMQVVGEQTFTTNSMPQQNINQRTVIEETYTTDNNLGGNGLGYGTTGYNQGTYLGENQVYNNEVDEFGRPKKAGFFSNLKNKMSHKKEPKNY